MSILNIFRQNKKTSAETAKQRLLQLIVDQRKMSHLDLDMLQKELIEVISRYLPIDENDEVTVEVEQDESVLELKLYCQNPLKTNVNPLQETSES